MWIWETTYHQQMLDIIEYSKLVYDRQLVSAAGGNVSARCGDYILITASNDSLRNVTKDDLLLCDKDGKVIEGSTDLKPSKETKFHLNIYAARPNVNCVIHAHPCCSTAFSLSKTALPLYTDSAKLKLGQVPIIAKAQPGSTELADNVSKAVGTSYPQAMVFLMEAHGILSLGATMKESFDGAELLEDTAKVAILKRLME